MAYTQKPTYADPAYHARQSLVLGALAAGNAGVTATAALPWAVNLFDLTLNLATLGTSTYTVNGTATKSGQAVNLITIVNANAFTTNTVSLSTTTYGPFYAGGYAGTAQVNSVSQYQINTNTATGSLGFGGVNLPMGSVVYCVSGTDATAVTDCTLSYEIAPGSPITQ
jgi:hypothetical protein